MVKNANVSAANVCMYVCSWRCIATGNAVSSQRRCAQQRLHILQDTTAQFLAIVCKNFIISSPAGRCAAQKLQSAEM